VSPELFQSIRDITAAGMLAFALIGGTKKFRFWVFGWLYDEMVRDRDRWRDIALRSLSATERSAAIAESVVRPPSDVSSQVADGYNGR
jgi:hypothetical protein